jgi:hypothetical protein
MGGPEKHTSVEKVSSSSDPLVPVIVKKEPEGDENRTF